MNLYFNEYNLLMGSGGISYLPFVSGILAANAKKINKIKKRINFKPYIFVPDTADNLIKNYYDEKPDIAVFSISMWNEQLSLEVAKKIKEKWDPLIIFGGPSCPHNPTEYFKKHKFIDIAVRAEGEDAFNEILIKHLNGQSFEDIPNVSFRNKNDECQINLNGIKFNKNLDVYPSPYLSGEYDYLFEGKKEHKYQIIVETNRGCPFLCTYCYWGKGGTTTKYRFHSLERVFKEIEWIAEKKIKYVFNADSNFGMHRRDIEIAKKLVDTKIKTGYPEKFRTCWGKNTSEQIFKIASLLNLHDMEKGVTLARQTNSKEALKNVKRDNIKLDVYSDLEKKFNHLNIPVYAEMILGLPGETNVSWEEGLSSLVDTSINNQIFIYQAEIYPNTEMNEEAYRKKHGIISKTIKLNEIHCSPREQEWLKEYQDIVVGTNSMTTNDWKRRNLFSVVLMVLHSFKAGFYFLNYFMNELKIPSRYIFSGFMEYANPKDTPFIYKNVIEKIHEWTDNILKGEGRGIFIEKFSDVYLDIEEVIFVNLSNDWEKFYYEFNFILIKILNEKNYNINHNILDEIKKYQILRMPSVNQKKIEMKFDYNIAEYMYGCSKKEFVPLEKKKNIIETHDTKDFKDNIQDFVKYKIIWARKSDKIKNEIDFDVKMQNIQKEKNINLDNMQEKKKDKLFEKINKFEKYSAINLKNQRRLN